MINDNNIVAELFKGRLVFPEESEYIPYSFTFYLTPNEIEYGLNNTNILAVTLDFKLNLKRDNQGKLSNILRDKNLTKEKWYISDIASINNYDSIREFIINKVKALDDTTKLKTSKSTLINTEDEEYNNACKKLFLNSADFFKVEKTDISLEILDLTLADRIKILYDNKVIEIKQAYLDLTEKQFNFCLNLKKSNKSVTLKYIMDKVIKTPNIDNVIDSSILIRFCSFLKRHYGFSNYPKEEKERLDVFFETIANSRNNNTYRLSCFISVIILMAAISALAFAVLYPINKKQEESVQTITQTSAKTINTTSEQAVLDTKPKQVSNNTTSLVIPTQEVESPAPIVKPIQIEKKPAPVVKSVQVSEKPVPLVKPVKVSEKPTPVVKTVQVEKKPAPVVVKKDIGTNYLANTFIFSPRELLEAQKILKQPLSGQIDESVNIKKADIQSIISQFEKLGFTTSFSNSKIIFREIEETLYVNCEGDSKDITLYMLNIYAYNIITSANSFKITIKKKQLENLISSLRESTYIKEVKLINDRLYVYPIDKTTYQLNIYVSSRRYANLLVETFRSNDSFKVESAHVDEGSGRLSTEIRLSTISSTKEEIEQLSYQMAIKTFSGIRKQDIKIEKIK